MVSFRKNKADTATKKHRYRYDIVPAQDDEIADVLLEKREDSALRVSEQIESKPTGSEPVEKAEEVIYELVVEDKTEHLENKPPVTEESASTASLNKQVERLCREYELVNQKLEQSLLASVELNEQLEKSRKMLFISYTGLGLAAVALLFSIAVIVNGANIQRKLSTLTSDVTSVNSHLQLEKKAADLKAKEVDGRVAQINAKIDAFFAVDNLDHVIAAAKKLKKNHQKLEAKNLLDVAHLSNEQDGLKAALTSNIKADVAKKEQTDRLASLDTSDNWTVSLGSFKSKTAANTRASKFKKKGVPLEVIEIKVKNRSWYRVVVKTFKNKQDAQNYAERLKKTLGIHSVSVTRS
jgi:hypothetical protein